MPTDLKDQKLILGTRLRNPLDVEVRIVGIAAPHRCIGTVYEISGDSPMTFATREGLERSDYEVVTDE